jgi:hypothetical protein
MHKSVVRVLAGVVGVMLLAASPQPVRAQEPGSASLAKELATLLQEKKLDAIAARQPGSPDAFIAALYFPGQLLVVSARTTAPAILNEKLIRREFRDVYIDLNSASITESRVLITDMGADGLKARRENNAAFDTQDAAGKGFRFDGNWREDRMSEQDYMKTFSTADEGYGAALRALLDELKKSTS